MYGHQCFTLTKNNHGVMHLSLNPISKAFIEYALNCTGTVLDIGAAYGVATIPILKGNPRIKVIACDISKKHLEDLGSNVKKIEKDEGLCLSDRLTLLEQKFPDFDLEENSVDAILASHVLPFLTGIEIENGIKKMAKFLKPGGRVYIASYSIYNKVMNNYIDTYEKRKRAGEPWPGEIEDASLFWDISNPLTAILPKKLNHLEPCLIECLIKENKFKIDYLGFLSLDEEIPADMKLDGREAMGLIAAQIK